MRKRNILKPQWTNDYIKKLDLRQKQLLKDNMVVQKIVNLIQSEEKEWWLGDVNSRFYDF